MQKYFYAVIEREIVSKKEFQRKEDAVEYFNEKYGKTILNEQVVKENKIKASIRKCEKKLQGVDKSQEQILDLKRRKEIELEQLHALMGKENTGYIWDCNGYRKRLGEQKETTILHTSGIYKIAGGKLQILEEKFVCFTEYLEGVHNAEDVCRKIPRSFIGKREALFAAPMEMGMKKIIDSVSKIRAGMLKEFKGNEMRI